MSIPATLSVAWLSRAAPHLVMAETLRTILLACRTRGVSCVPLRGVALSEQLYGDPLARRFGDVDLLVRKSELSPIAEILRALGYREIDRRRDFAREFSYTLEFFTMTPVPLVVEPHWSLAYPPFVERLDMQPVWQRCVPTHLLGVDTLQLSPEDCLLNLCLHLMHHRAAAPVQWLAEIDRLIRQQAEHFRWELVQETAFRAGVGRLAAQALRRAHAAHATPLPVGCLEALEQARPGRASLAERISEQAGVEGRESLAMFFALRGCRARWRYAWALLVPSAEFMRLHYGLATRRQVGWWYLKRFGRLCLEAGKGLWQGLSGSLARRSSSAA